MKLYFYFLETPYKREPCIRFEECEVEEKPKTYKPIDKLPKGYYYCSVKKEEIGKLARYNSDVVILTEKDTERVSEIFMEKCNGRIARANSDIESAKSTIKEQNFMLKMIDEWRSVNASKN